MNSLTYLSRQFDVIASPRAPPSTPTTERSAFLSDRRLFRDGDDSGADANLKRVKTWSTKSFLFPPPSPPPLSSSSPSGRAPKRSFSSPAGGFLAITSVRRSSATPEPAPTIAPKSSLESAIRHVFLVRVFLLLWNALRAAWRSWTTACLGRPENTVRIEVTAVTEEKDDDEPMPNLPPKRPLRPPIPPFSDDPPLLEKSPIPSPDLESPISPSMPHLELEPKSASPLPPPPAAASVSRASTPVLSGARKTAAIHVPKTLVLDLDETLIHSTSRPLFASSAGAGVFGLGFGRRNTGAGHMVEVVLGGRSTLYHVYKRPFVDYFLRKVSAWYTLVIFTASMQEYADPVIDWLDAGRGILARRLFRESCTQLPNGSYTKDLSLVEQDLSRVCLVDNSPISYRINEANGIPIEGWTHDPSDEALLALLPVLDSLRFTNDVRRVLGIRGFS